MRRSLVRHLSAQRLIDISRDVKANAAEWTHEERMEVKRQMTTLIHELTCATLALDREVPEPGHVPAYLKHNGPKPRKL